MIEAKEAVRTARGLLGTPYSEMDCINLIKRVIRTSSGGDTSYTTAGTNALWRSYEASGKYKHLTWRQEGTDGALGGMLAFKRSGEDVHHVGLVTGEGTVIHSSSAKGCVVETALDGTWQLLAKHRCIGVAGDAEQIGGTQMTPYKMQVSLADESSTLNVRDEPDKAGSRIGRLSHGAVVTIQAEYDTGWKYITYGDNGVGYVDGSFLAPVEEKEETSVPAITIVDSDGNRFCPVGDWHVCIGSVD